MSCVESLHTAPDGTASRAVFSDCGTYRYRLTRRWGPEPTLLFIMLNPSTADAQRNDPTIARCEKRARVLGFGGVDIANLFAFRATDPSDLKSAAAPEGPQNQGVLATASAEAGMVLAAWGVHGTHLGQDQKVLSALAPTDLHVLGLTRHGHPRHPLYVSYSARPVLWRAAMTQLTLS